MKHSGLFWEIIRSVGYVKEKNLKLNLFHAIVVLSRNGMSMTQKNSYTFLGFKLGFFSEG